MEAFKDYLEGLDNPGHQKKMEELLAWIMNKFPELEPKIAWNQPMFTDHDTYIMGLSASKKHVAIAPERAGMIRFTDDIKEAGYDHTKELVRFPWNKPVDYELIEKMIAFNIMDKADCATFWRK